MRSAVWRVHRRLSDASREHVAAVANALDPLVAQAIENAAQMRGLAHRVVEPASEILHRRLPVQRVQFFLAQHGLQTAGRWMSQIGQCLLSGPFGDLQILLERNRQNHVVRGSQPALSLQPTVDLVPLLC